MFLRSLILLHLAGVALGALILLVGEPGCSWAQRLIGLALFAAAALSALLTLGHETR